MLRAMTDPAALTQMVEQTMSNPQMSKQISEMIPKLMASTNGMASIANNPNMKQMFDQIAKQMPGMAGLAVQASGPVGPVGPAGLSGPAQLSNIFGEPDSDGTL